MDENNKNKKVAPNQKTLIIVRGIVATGKSYLAKKLAGTDGIICSVDHYFYTQVGKDNHSYDYNRTLVKKAVDWNFKKFSKALKNQTNKIIVEDIFYAPRGPRNFVIKALRYNYRIEIKEPTSPWWQAIKICLMDKENNINELRQWAQLLYMVSKNIHNVSYNNIFERMMKWHCNITVKDIIES